MVPLWDFDAVGEDLDGKGVVGNFLSISIQFCRGREGSRSHPLCGVPCGQERSEARKDRISQAKTIRVHLLSSEQRSHIQTLAEPLLRTPAVLLSWRQKDFQSDFQWSDYDQPIPSTKSSPVVASVTLRSGVFRGFI